MIEQSHDRIVNFMLCRYCRYSECPESAEPCSDCLEYPANVDSRRPVHFEAKDIGELEKALKELQEL